MTYTAEELAQHMENDCMLVGWDDVPAMLRSQATEIAHLRETLDAQRWRAQQEWISKAIACELRCEGGGDEILDGRNPNPPECDPRA